MDWLGTVKAIAPTVASALGGPLAGAAVAALGNILGVSDATQETIKTVIENGQMTPDHIAEIRKLELQYQNDEKERAFRYSELEFKDRNSARQREAAVKDSTNQILAYAVVGSFVAVVAGTLLGISKVDSVLAGTLVGYLSAKAEQVLAYYFGSSAGSDKKTELLAKAPPVQS